MRYQFMHEFPSIEFIEEIQELENQPIIAQGYQAAFTMIKAEHLKFPWEKLESFNQGKTALEKLILEHASLIELRFIRLVLQHHTPSILGYNDKIKEDIGIFLMHAKTANISGSYKSEMIQMLLSYDSLEVYHKKLTQIQ